LNQESRGKAAGVSEGGDAQQAFAAAARRVGRAGVLTVEFKKVENVKRFAHRKAMGWLIGLAFLSCSVEFGRSPAVGFSYGVLLAGLIMASFIDFEQFIIPDGLTFGGIVVGVICSSLLPQLHGQSHLISGMLQSVLGMFVGAGLLYLVLRLGKLAFGLQRLKLADGAKVLFSDTALLLPDRAIPYSELFYRKSDAVTLNAWSVKTPSRAYSSVLVRLTPTSLHIGDDHFLPEEVPQLEATDAEIVLPREAMGMGDVKLMAAIGSFLGWQATIFTLMASSVMGSLVGCGLVAARRRNWSVRMPYGPYLAAA